MKHSSLALICLVLSGGCSKIKEFEHKTASMERATSDMSATTNEMKSTTTTMYQQIRSKEAEDTRSKKFAALMNPKNDMGEKFTAAATYFKSFEFQLWNANVKYEDAESREVLFQDAANEFTRRITDVYEDVNLKKMRPDRNAKRHNAEKAFYALAGAMHMNHHYQEELEKKNKQDKAVSFYNLIKKSLLKDINGNFMEEHEIILMSGINKEIMIELVKARVDILAALAVKDLTDVRNITLGQKAKAVLFKITRGRLGSIQLPETFSTANEATRLTVEVRLDAAVKARNFLREIGISKNLEKTMQSALENIDFDEENENNNKAEDKHKANVRRLINEILG